MVFRWGTDPFEIGFGRRYAAVEAGGQAGSRAHTSRGVAALPSVPTSSASAIEEHSNLITGSDCSPTSAYYPIGTRWMRSACAATGKARAQRPPATRAHAKYGELVPRGSRRCGNGSSGPSTGWSWELRRDRPVVPA